ncbi:MAG: oligosaccharide flippase family protein [Crocinitomicaceae bacterium]|nr:oligosaccharide flippase family protein [Crocinitomicaceae bacterium]
MLKQIFKYGFIEAIAKGLNKLLFLVLPIFIHTIDYGKISLLVSIELVLPFITLLGFDKTVIRFYSSKELFVLFEDTINVSIKWVHIFLAALVGICYLAGFNHFVGLNIFPDIFLILLLVYLQGKNTIFVGMLRVNEQHMAYFKNRIILQFSKFIAVILFTYFTRSYLGYLYGSIIGILIVNLLFVIQYKNFKIMGSFSKETFSKLLLFSWPFIFHGVSINLLGNADKFILESYLSLEEVGLYTFAYSIGSAMIFSFIGVSVFVEPLIYKETDDKKRKLLVDKFLFYTMLFGILAYIAISFISDFFIEDIYSEKYRQVSTYIPLIAISYIIYPYYLMSNYNLTFDKKTKTIAFVSIFNALLNILLNVLFVPKFGIIASVFSNIASYIIQSILFVFVSSSYKMTKDLLEVTIFGLIIFLLSFFQVHYFFVSLVLLTFTLYIYLYKVKGILNER